MKMLEKVKKQKQPETLAMEILREYKNRLYISLAASFILLVAVILTIIFSWTSRKRGIK